MAVFDFFKKNELEEINNLKKELERYKAISDIESEVNKKKIELSLVKNNLTKIKYEYENTLKLYEKIKDEVGVFETKLDIIEYGIYEPVYDFAKSEEYRLEQDKIITLQKNMITSDIAAICNTNWSVEGSEVKGKSVVKIYKKLMLRAFNGECDALVSKVKWNNVNQINERLQKLFDTINKLGQGFRVYLNEQYFDLKKSELILEYEYQLKKQEEKEELRAAQEAIREEEKAMREFEQAQREAEREEVNYQKALEKAREEIESAVGEKHEKLQAKISQLEQEVKTAQEKKERAMSMAQQTKRGHVYIISNVGSFGENVYKIGMTRRLEPKDRVRELSGASVPFNFDIHAMVFSEDAPTLEKELHRKFSNCKVNMINYRKEFFKVNLDELEADFKKNNLVCDFKRLPEAEEYRETIAILRKMETQDL